MAVLGFFVAAVVPGAAAGLALVVTESLGGGVLDPLDALAGMLLGVVFGVEVTMLAILVAGIPAHLLYRRLGWSDWPRHLLGGAVIGWAAFGFLSRNPECSRDGAIADLLGWIACLPVGLQLVGAVLGAASALVFWSITYRRRPWLFLLGVHAAYPLLILVLRTLQALR